MSIRRWAGTAARSTVPGTLVGIDHIVYGTDYFIVGTKFMDWTNEFLEGLDLSPIEREKIYGKNAARILNL
jgi:predicted TIM-barrel fold metal-dependent hydrolase